jgi:hypothetical protein
MSLHSLALQAIIVQAEAFCQHPVSLVRILMCWELSVALLAKLVCQVHTVHWVVQLLYLAQLVISALLVVHSPACVLLAHTVPLVAQLPCLVLLVPTAQLQVHLLLHALLAAIVHWAHLIPL